jgi:predicted Zn-dependent peptidase
VDTIHENVQLPAIYIAYKVPSINSKENQIFDLLSLILSSGKSSRLYKNIVYEKKLAKSINTMNYDLELGGLFVISSTGFPRTDLTELKEQIDQIIQAVSNEDISERELQKAKNKYETSFENRTQTVLGKAELLNHYRTFYNNTYLVNSEIDKLQDITTDDIKKAAKEYLTGNNRVILLYYTRNSNNN